MFAGSAAGKRGVEAAGQVHTVPVFAGRSGILRTVPVMAFVALLPFLGRPVRRWPQ